jgi:hypothetical protein
MRRRSSDPQQQVVASRLAILVGLSLAFWFGAQMCRKLKGLTMFHDVLEAVSVEPDVTK